MDEIFCPQFPLPSGGPGILKAQPKRWIVRKLLRNPSIHNTTGFINHYKRKAGLDGIHRFQPFDDRVRRPQVQGSGARLTAWSSREDKPVALVWPKELIK